MSPKRIVLSWSSGKDSAWALKTLRENPASEVVALLTTYASSDRRVPIQFTRIELVQAQARILGLPLILTPLPNPCSVVEYESAINFALMEAMTNFDAEAVAFADIFQSAIREYREKFCATIPMETLFPLWGRDTRELAEEMFAAGLKAWVTAIDTSRMPNRLLGRAFDLDFLSALPADVDPCGERGGFHTFCWGGPVFPRDLELQRGQQLVQGSYAYQDFCPAGQELGLEEELPAGDKSGKSRRVLAIEHEVHMESPAAVRPSQYNLPSVRVNDSPPAP